MTATSLNLYFNFIEIEDHAKKIFHASRQELPADFSHAYNHLMQWRAMTEEVAAYFSELCKMLFANNYNNTPIKYVHYKYFLLYGFSDEVIDRKSRYNGLLNEYFTNADIHHCTFRRLTTRIKHYQRMFTVKKEVSTGGFRSIGWIPFTKYHIDEWSDFSKISGKEIIINRRSRAMSKKIR